INGIYTQSFNKRYGKSGHIFQGRYKAVLVQKDSHLLAVSRYIVLNPVRAGMTDKPETWSWSSYRATAGYEKSHPCLTVDWILSHFEIKKKTALTKYRLFVQEGIKQESIWKDLRGQSLLGEDDFVVEFSDYLKDREKIHEIPKSQRLMHRPPISALFTPEIIRNRKRRNETIVEAVSRHGYKQKEVADLLGLHYSTVSRLMKDYV
ncbi:MAG: helix-turn-helix domain-containing protein, partial [Syntrophales bacterium]|nr:helix-turn-helix domain-containing protein [Syntrophales bacterium]